MKVDHILRPEPPWRRVGARTECGLDASSYPTITRDELEVRFKELGEQRTAMVCCMTCLSTARRWPDWMEDPVAALNRETARQREGNREFEHELRAIMALVEEHRQEFDQLLESLRQVRSLAPKRAMRRYMRLW